MSHASRSKMLGAATLVALFALILQACGGAPTATAKPASTAAPAATSAPAATTAPVATATRGPVAPATAAPVATGAPAATAGPTPSAGIPGMASFPQAKRGGVVNVSNSLSPAGWEPYRQLSVATHGPMINTYDTLVGRDNKDYNSVVPYLARSWKVSPDGLMWTLELNKGVKFQDGTPFTASDVAFTFTDRLINTPAGLPTPRGRLALLKEVKAVDDYTVNFALTQPYASFISGYLSYNRITVYSQAYVKANGYAAMDKFPPAPFTGPFIAKEYVKDNSVELVRNPIYWVPGRPFLDGVKFFIIPDAGTILANFLTGQINVAPLTPPGVKESQQRLGDKATFQSTPSLVPDFVQMNQLNKPIDDIRVRKAIAYAIDKEGVSIAATRPHVPGGFLLPGSKFALSNQELGQFAGYGPDHAANIQKAKALLAEAGFPNGFKVRYIGRSTATPVIPTQSYLKEIGITGDIRSLEIAPYDIKVGNSGDTDWDVTQMTQSVNSDDPNDELEAYQISSGARNSTGVKDKYIDDAYAKQNAALDPAERIKIVQDIERYVLGQYRYVLLSWGTTNLSASAFVKNAWVSPSVGPNNYRDVWIEK